MPIQFLLTLGLLASLLYASVQRVVPRVINLSFATVVAVAIYFVWLPDHTTIVARLLGVARGTDLLIYIWILLTLFVGLNLRLKIRAAREEITELTRAMALASARSPEGNPPPDAPPQDEERE